MSPSGDHFAEQTDKSARRGDKSPAEHSEGRGKEHRWCYSLLFSRLLAELHRDSLYPMMGKDAWVAGADRGEAPGPKPVRLGRRLRLRRQPPGSWQLWNGGVQRGVSNIRIEGKSADRLASAPFLWQRASLKFELGAARTPSPWVAGQSEYSFYVLKRFDQTHDRAQSVPLSVPQCLPMKDANAGGAREVAV